MENIRQNWEDPNPEMWISVDSSTINIDQIDVGDLEDTSNRYTYFPIKTQDVTVFVSCDIGEENVKHDCKCQIKKIFWHPKRGFDFIHCAENNIIFLEGSEDYLGFTGEAVESLKESVPVNLWDRQDMYFGGVHAVIPGSEGAGDPRRGGAVVSVSHK